MGPGGQHAACWESYLNRLDALLAGGELSEAEAHRVTPELNERYAIAFGEDAARGRESFARYGPLPLSLDEGPVLRFEWPFAAPDRARLASDQRARRARPVVPSDAEFEVTDSEPPRLLIGSFWGDRLRFELTGTAMARYSSRLAGSASATTPLKTAAGWDRCFTRMQASWPGPPSTRAKRSSLAAGARAVRRVVRRRSRDRPTGVRAAPRVMTRAAAGCQRASFHSPLRIESRSAHSSCCASSVRVEPVRFHR